MSETPPDEPLDDEIEVDVREPVEVTPGDPANESAELECG